MALLYEELSNRVLGLAFSVHRELGSGLLEAVYEGAFCVELSQTGIPFERQKPFSVIYKGEAIGEYYADLVVDGKILLELKAVKRLTEVMEAQVINYLKISGLEAGYLVNFNGLKLEWKRYVNGIGWSSTG